MQTEKNVERCVKKKKKNPYLRDVKEKQQQNTKDKKERENTYYLPRIN